MPLSFSVGTAPVKAASETHADAFYLERLDAGIAANAARKYGSAVNELRTAAFGLLDHPEQLTRALLHLGVAQHRSADRSGFQQTFNRLLAVDGRFSSYTEGEILSELRDNFETAVRELVPAASLVQTDAFAHLSVTAPRPELDALSPRKLRKTLEHRRATDPSSAEWDLRLADLAESEKRISEAVDAVSSALLKVDSAGRLGGELHCRRGQLLALDKRCGEALEDLALCPLVERRSTLAGHQIACLRAEGRNDQAKQFLAKLPVEIRTTAVVEDSALDLLAIGESLETETAEAPPIPAPSEASSESATSLDLSSASQASTQPSTSERQHRSASGIAAEDLQTLKKSQALAAAARNSEEIEAALSLARQVAQQNPNSRAAQYTAAQLAYRASLWTEAIDFFERGGELTDDQPHLLFYYAVSLYELGRTDPALQAIERSLPQLERTPFVDTYLARIRAAANHN